MDKKEAIEQLKIIKNNIDKKYINTKNSKAIETVLNLLEKKDKMIDLMAEKFEDLKLAYFKKEDGGEFMGKYRTYNKNDWEQYFERKVENGN